MKLKLLLSAACITFSSCSFALAANNVLPKQIFPPHSGSYPNKFSAGFKSEGPSNSTVNGFAQIFAITQPIAVRNNTILSMFEPASIPSGESISLRISSDQRGLPVITPLNTASQKGVVYCEQAVWDAWPLLNLKNLKLADSTGTCKFAGADGKFTCSKLLTARGNNSFVMHVIPPSFFLLYPGTFSQAELHDVPNLKVVCLGPTKVAALKSYRIEWLRFAKSKEHTRQEILQKADELTSKFHSLFEKQTESALKR